MLRLCLLGARCVSASFLQGRDAVCSVPGAGGAVCVVLLLGVMLWCCWLCAGAVAGDATCAVAVPVLMLMRPR